MGVFVNQESGTSCSDMARLCRKVVPFHILSLDPRANKCNQCASKWNNSAHSALPPCEESAMNSEHQLRMPLISHNFQCFIMPHLHAM